VNYSQISKAENLEADVVVMGGGGCGMAAAVAAAEKGAKVILMEKKGAPGGNSAFAVGLFAAESQAQRRLSIDVTKDEMFKIAMDYAHWKVNPRIFRAFIDKSGDTIRWLEEKGLKFDNIPPLYPGHNIRTWHSLAQKDAGPVILKALRKNCEDLGVRLLFHCTAKKILTGNKGEVIGVLAAMKGKELKINAKTVIIGTGGYGGSQELLKKYRPSYSENMVYIGFPHVTGDGLLMAIEAGAATEGLGTLILHTHFYEDSKHVNGIAQEPATLWVNKNGERFADETITFHPTECGNIIDRQPDKCVYSLFDDKVTHKVMEEGLHKGDLEPIPGLAGTKPANLDKELRAEAEKGNVRISNSWDDIAAWMGVAPKVLKATVEEYNSFCEQGHDEIFDKNRRYLQALRTPPYYAVRCYLCFLTTIGGIKINPHMEVLNNQDKPIPGLYAGGDTTGGWESDTYCIHLSGSAFGFAVNSGRIAGENAAEYVLG
jgi:fumarate reductase flavoprotein subunit